MVTVEQILAAEGEELSRLLGEVLQPEKKNMCQGEHTFGKPRCHFCGRRENFIDDIKLKVCTRRPQQKPIPLNWDNAMKWRDWAVNKHGRTQFTRAIVKAMSKYEDKMSIAVCLGFPKHYLQAAAICKLNAEKGKK